MEKSSHNKLYAVKDISLETEENTLDVEELSCKECMILKRGDCFGAKEICDLFKFSPAVTKREKERWPQYGDATAFKLGKKR